MALGPPKRSTSRIQRQERRINAAERVIDKAIRGCDDLDEEITIDVSLLNINMNEWLLLSRRYKKAGWKAAQWIVDNRDGDYIKLTP